MQHLTDLVLGLFGIALGSFVLFAGSCALLYQDKFLRLSNKWQKTEQFSMKPFDLDYFGGPTKLRFLGIAMIASGLFLLASVIHILLSRLQ